MEIKRVKQSLGYLFKTGVVPFLWSEHGVGKSMLVAQWCQENGYKFVDIRLGNMETGDLVGLPDFELDARGRKVATRFITPDWIKDVIDFCEAHPDKGAVIFLDEINRAMRSVLQAVFQMVLDKKHHLTEFPKNCHFIAASNPPDENYIVTDIGDQAFMSRFCHIRLTPSVKEWLDYADETGVDKEVTNFVRQQPELLDGTKATVDLEVKPCRRSMVAVSKLKQTGIPQDLLQELCYGLLGKPATLAFMESLNQADKPIPATDILTSFSKVEDRVKAFSDPETGGRPDLLKVTCDDLKKVVEKEEKLLTKKKADNLLKFLKVIPADISFNFVRATYIFNSMREHYDNDTELLEILKKKEKGTK